MYLRVAGSVGVVEAGRVLVEGGDSCRREERYCLYMRCTMQL